MRFHHALTSFDVSLCSNNAKTESTEAVNYHWTAILNSIKTKSHKKMTEQSSAGCELIINKTPIGPIHKRRSSFILLSKLKKVRVKP